MVQDARYAFRQLRKNPGFTAIAILTLGLGIGAAAAMFGLIQGVLLSPPPYERPDQLVLVQPVRLDGKPYEGRPTTAEWIAWRTSSRTLEAPALFGWRFNFLIMQDGSESLSGMVVTTNYFRVLGLKPILGREFTDGDAGHGNAPPTAIVLGHDLWKRRFNSDPAIVGTPIRLSRMPAPLPVVGVMPAGVRFLPDPGNANEPGYDVDAPVDFWLASIPDETRLTSRGWNVVTRLRSGATVSQANAEVAAIAASQPKSDDEARALTATARPLLEVMNGEGRRLLMPLFGSVVLVFLIACGNVAGLLLARGLQRHQEYAVRSALGAGRVRLFRQLLTESVTLALMGALVGGALAGGIVTLLKAIGGHAVPRADAVTVGWRVYLFGVVAALIAAVVAGLLPAVRASAAHKLQGLEGTRTSASLGERRLLRSVATLQIVLTVALLSGAALLIRTASNLARVRPGYDTENILAMTVASVQQNTWKDFHARALDKLAALPGVTHTAFVWGLPLTGNKWTGDVEILGQPGTTGLDARINASLRAVTPDYFAAMGVSLAEGRSFQSTDDNGTPRVAIVNDAFAQRHLGGANPLGKQIRFPGAKETIDIVGSVSDIKTDALDARAEPEIYFPLWQMRAFSKHLILRAASDPRALGPLVRSALREIEPTAAVEHITTMAEIRRESLAPRTFAMRLLTAFAIVATVLALIGLYGVLSLSVASRTREIGVRQAIGAQRHEIVGLVLREGVRLIALGVLLGAGAALLAGRVLATLLFEVRPTDPLTLAGAAAVFCVVALGACSLPAWRASRVDIINALRHE